jgi:hypothetical protein
MRAGEMNNNVTRSICLILISLFLDQGVWAEEETLNSSIADYGMETAETIRENGITALDVIKRENLRNFRQSMRRMLDANMVRLQPDPVEKALTVEKIFRSPETQAAAAGAL